MRSWLIIGIFTAAALAPACRDFTSSDAEVVREHVLAIETDLELVPWCGTARLNHAQQINEFGEAGWQCAVQSSKRPEEIQSLRSLFERMSQNNDE